MFTVITELNIITTLGSTIRILSDDQFFTLFTYSKSRYTLSSTTKCTPERHFHSSYTIMVLAPLRAINGLMVVRYHINELEYNDRVFRWLWYISGNCRITWAVTMFCRNNYHSSLWIFQTKRTYLEENLIRVNRFLCGRTGLIRCLLEIHSLPIQCSVNILLMYIPNMSFLPRTVKVLVFYWHIRVWVSRLTSHIQVKNKYITIQTYLKRSGTKTIVSWRLVRQSSIPLEL